MFLKVFVEGVILSQLCAHESLAPSTVSALSSPCVTLSLTDNDKNDISRRKHISLFLSLSLTHNNYYVFIGLM